MHEMLTNVLGMAFSNILLKLGTTEDKINQNVGKTRFEATVFKHCGIANKGGCFQFN